jgi:hypothetical protein
MSEPWPAEGCALTEAFERIFRRDAWQAAHDLAEIDLIRSTGGGGRWRDSATYVQLGHTFHKIKSHNWL